MSSRCVIVILYIVLSCSFLKAKEIPLLEQGRIRPLTSNEETVLSRADFSHPWIDAYAQEVALMIHQGKSGKEIARRMEQKYSLKERLEALPNEGRILPGRFSNQTWYPLSGIHLLEFNPDTMQLEPISNFTLYPDRTFRKLQELKDWARIKNVLIESYDQLAGRPYIQAAGKSILYPSQAKLVLEKLYFSWPLLPLALASYICALFFYKRPVGTLLFLLAFLLHTCILGIRSFILNRPPVSNMEETVLYVPWVASLTALLLTLSLRKKTYLAIGASTASILLGLYALKYTGTPFSQVQAVLDSQFWLLIHVLMVVGSYGLFIIAGIIAHITLIRSRFIHSLETHTPLIRGLIQCLYAGVALLILGTILGGIWAAQSWGRFWDWDPKESWAFISCCIYLVLIHLYRFGKIGSSGLAVGAIIGLQAIGFTWYGVNYILGTGLHSYGFGQGGEWWFYSFSLSELIFLGLIGCKKPLNQI